MCRVCAHSTVANKPADYVSRELRGEDPREDLRIRYEKTVDGFGQHRA